LDGKRKRRGSETILAGEAEAITELSQREKKKKFVLSAALPGQDFARIREG